MKAEPQATKWATSNERPGVMCSVCNSPDLVCILNPVEAVELVHPDALLLCLFCTDAVLMLLTHRQRRADAKAKGNA